MILITANRLDAYEGFQFRIEGTDMGPEITNSAIEAIEILISLAVSEPEPLVAHARKWGSVEINNR